MAGVVCPSCGAANAAGAKFCGGCGIALETVSTMAGGVASGKTMVMPQAPAAPAAAPAPSAPAPSTRLHGPARTVLGMVVDIEKMQAAAAAKAPSPSGTIQGAPTPVAAVPAAGASGPRAAGPARTMLGMALPAGVLTAAAPPAEATPPVATAPMTATRRPAPAEDAPDPPPRPAQESRRVPTARSPAQAQEPAADDDDIDIPGLSRRRPANPVAIMIVGVLVILALAGAAIWFFVIRGGSDGAPTDVAVTRSPDGATAILEMRLPAAAPGTKVRIAAHEADVAGGVARFPIPISELAVGPNDLVATIAAPGADPDERRIRVFLSYRARADLAALAGTPPRYDVVFDLPAGARVEAFGTALPAGPDGRAVLPVAIADVDSALDAEGRHRLDFRVVLADGTPEAGTLATTVPLTRLTVDRPGAEAVTDAAQIECAGVTEDGAAVVVNGAPVTVVGGRFATPVPLPAVGSHPVAVRATAPGKAAKTTSLTVRRVQSLRAEMLAFEREVDRALTWEAVRERGAALRGQKVAFVGEIFNIRSEAGTTAIQALVRGCPSSQRCSIWVVYRGTTDAQNRDVVKILGVLGGEQTYVTSRGEQLTVPRIEARFVAKTR